jgi:hypothetical protein
MEVNATVTVNGRKPIPVSIGEKPRFFEQVTELAAEKKETAESQGVRGDYPLSLAGREVERLLGGRKGDVHDRGVERHHQLGHSEERQNRPSVRFSRALKFCHSGLFLYSFEKWENKNADL